MKDIYGLLLVLGFLLIISQCTSNTVEKFLNGNGLVDEVVSDVKGLEQKVENVVMGKPQQQRATGKVAGYNPGSLLLADANGKYGFEVPPSMQQDFTTNLSFGKSQVPAPKSFVSFSDEQLQGAPIDASMKTFDPSAKGGLPGLIGKTPPTPSAPPAKTDGLFDVKKGPVASQAQPQAPGAQKGSNKTLKVYMVYGAWCGWSKKALGPFKEAMGQSVTTSNGTPVEFVLIEDKSSEFEGFKGMVKGFPTFVIGKFENGKEVSKELLNVKDRTKDGFINAAKSVNY
jgi:hypothetical protein